MVATGCTIHPPIVAMCTRVGWVLGRVKDEYLFRDKSVDQYAGRCNRFLEQQKKSKFQFPNHILILQNYVILRS